MYQILSFRQGVILPPLLPPPNSTLKQTPKTPTQIRGYPFLKNLSKENDKKNNGLLKINSSEHINKFINDLSSYSLHPQILLPTRISGDPK